MRVTAGLTLLELMVALVATAVIGGGTLMAFMSAAQMTQRQLTPAVIEANHLAMQTIEKYRNQVAADNTWLATRATMPWQSDPLPGGAGTESMQGGARRCIRVRNACAGACYQVEVRVCWGSFGACGC
jgi:type II secretory pathway component PulJ